MKILYINRNRSDYLQDILYSGITKISGVSSVVEMPWNDKFHLSLKKYPRNIGYKKNSLMRSLVSRLGRNDYDLVIVASCHPDTLSLYLGLMPGISDDVPRVFIDGGDWPQLAGDLDRIGGRGLYDEIIQQRPFDFIFKREVIIGESYDDNVFPLPFGFNFDRIPTLPDEKKYDVSFWAVESDPVRTQALTLLQDKFDCASNGTERNQVMSKYKRKGDFYLQELSRCKICLNFRGAGWDTLRYWEVPALGGFMITQKPGIVIDNNFVDRQDVVYCKPDLSDLIELCEYYLENEEEREQIARNALRRTKEFHTDRSRAEYVLKTCGLI